MLVHGSDLKLGLVQSWGGRSRCDSRSSHLILPHLLNTFTAYYYYTHYIISRDRAQLRLSIYEPHIASDLFTQHNQQLKRVMGRHSLNGVVIRQIGVLNMYLYRNNIQKRDSLKLLLSTPALILPCAIFHSRSIEWWRGRTRCNGTWWP